jgi:hypothetical protein
MLLDAKRGKAQRQAIKSICCLLKNKRLPNMPILTAALANIISDTFFGAEEDSLVQDKDN